MILFSTGSNVGTCLIPDNTCQTDAARPGEDLCPCGQGLQVPGGHAFCAQVTSREESMHSGRQVGDSRRYYPPSVLVNAPFDVYVTKYALLVLSTCCSNSVFRLVFDCQAGAETTLCITGHSLMIICFVMSQQSYKLTNSM